MHNKVPLSKIFAICETQAIENDRFRGKKRKIQKNYGINCILLNSRPIRFIRSFNQNPAIHKNKVGKLNAGAKYT